ncbi:MULTISPECIES: hypothetical protein [unclassified Streptomyces]|uniref:hypothetical protein n=1 Tax=unclassified Streptomyces TaxID=2593676 RepID=UPI00166059AE|nr:MULTISPECIES: hypothetical protein [unclassified Streptomyces]MBD0707380.1 hypothetical protein [Streptomyces sp. CBMA291]MBD0715168.1 hypothetical protein [Streptomyces sp. CBMA370]
MTTDPILPLPVSTSPEYYLRLARQGTSGRALLLTERYCSRTRGLELYLSLLYGAVILDEPQLEPTPQHLSSSLASGDQRTLDYVDMLYQPLDQAALALASLDTFTHNERLTEYAERVGADRRLSTTPLHQEAPTRVHEALAERRGLTGYMEAVGFPTAGVIDLLTQVQHHANSLREIFVVDHSAIWRGPDGTHYVIGDFTYMERRYWLHVAAQDPDTRQWAKVDPAPPPLGVSEWDLHRQYVAVPRAPLADPRITRLGTLIKAVLADYENEVGRPAPSTENVLDALTAVEAIPDEARRQRHGAASSASRMGYISGRHRGGR